MIFKATLDTMAKLITVGVALLFIAIAILPTVVSKNQDSGIPIVLIAVLFFTYGFSYAFSPKAYELNENEIIIKRPFSSVIVHRSQIKELVPLEKGKLTWSIRTFGVGGLFGYFGEFWNKEFGSMTWYATRRDKAILIVTNKNKRIVITPDEVEKFVGVYGER